MKRFVLVFGLVLSFTGCNKPTEESCRKAISNMKSLLGTDSLNSDIAGDVRRCRGGSSKKVVDCAIAATSQDQLRACGFPLKVPPAAAGSGSAK